MKSVQKKRARSGVKIPREFCRSLSLDARPLSRPEEIGALSAADAIVVRLAMTIPAGRCAIRRRPI